MISEQQRQIEAKLTTLYDQMSQYERLLLVENQALEVQRLEQQRRQTRQNIEQLTAELYSLPDYNPPDYSKAELNGLIEQAHKGIKLAKQVRFRADQLEQEIIQKKYDLSLGKQAENFDGLESTAVLDANKVSENPASDVISSLTSVLLHDESAEVRSNAATALSLIGDSRATQALIAALKDPDSRVRANAASALGQIGKPATVSG